MKCVILGAGYATRLYPLTKNKPKPLLPIAGKPLVNYIIEKVEEVEEVDEIFIVTNKKFHEQFVVWLEENEKKFTKKVSLVWDGIIDEEQRLGGARGLFEVIKEKEINEDILIVAGDSLFDFSLKSMVAFFKEKKKIVCAAFKLKTKKEAKRFGVVKLKNKKIIDFEEKPENPKTNLMIIALYIFPKSDLNEIEQYVKRAKSGEGIGYLINYLFKKQDVYGHVFSGRFFDIGVLDDYKKANEVWK